jgi:hypothetical protein
VRKDERNGERNAARARGRERQDIDFILRGSVGCRTSAGKRWPFDFGDPIVTEKRRRAGRPARPHRTPFQCNENRDSQTTDKTDSPDFVPAVNQPWPVFWLAVIL